MFVRVEYSFIDLKNSSLLCVTIVVSFEIDFTQEGNELNLDLEVMDFSVNSVLNS